MHNTNEIINLVAKHANRTTRVHTFGIGNGADRHLITQCALKGGGHHYFIYNEQEIEEKVIMSLTNTHLDFHVLTELKVFDRFGKPLPIEYTSESLSHGKPCEWIALLDKDVKAHRY